MKTQKSVKYLKHRISRYDHPTRTISGSGNVKGKLIPGYESAKHAIEVRIGRLLKVHHIEKSRGQWIFCELR